MSPAGLNSKTFLFDLDMTLVDSSADHGQVVSFEIKNNPSPHQLPQLLSELGHQVGIVTSAPRNSAKEVLRRFNIYHDCLVAYEDTLAHKPDPAPIELALEMLAADRENTFFIGDAVADAEAAYHAGVTSIGAAWGIRDIAEYSSRAADILIHSPGKILRVDRLSRHRYAGEVLFSKDILAFHKGSMLRWGSRPKIYSLGRYFTTEDRRHIKSNFCANLLRLKEDDAPAAVLAEGFRSFLNHAEKMHRWVPDVVIPIPPKPKQRNRFEKILTPISTQTVLNGLIRTKDIPDYKTMDDESRSRAMGSDQIFKNNGDWTGKKILLVDDIYSSGNTISVCSKILEDSGASEVRVLVFGKTQKNFQVKNCPACNRIMRIRSHAKTRQVFWVCPGFPENICKVALPVDKP